MKECIYKNYDELPLMLNTDMVKDVLGISISSAYELMHGKDFPSIKIGNKIVVAKDKFIKYIDEQAKKQPPLRRLKFIDIFLYNLYTGICTRLSNLITWLLYTA